MLSQDGTINARKQIQLIHRALCDELAHAVQFAALGDRHARLGTDVELPAYRDALAFGIAPALEADVRADFAGQCARLAALSMLTSVGAALRRLLVLRRAAEHAARTGSITPSAFSSIAVAVHEECRHHDPLAILSALVGESRPELDEARKWLDGLLRIRELLTRPHGMVRPDDLPETSDGIRVVWRKNVVAVDGNQFELLSHVLPGHPGLGLRFVEQARVFRPGQAANLTSADCDDIAISLSCLSLAACEQLHRELGTLGEAL